MGQFDRRILPSDTAKQIKIWLCKSLREELYEAAEKLKNSRSRAWIGTYYREYVSYVRDQDKAGFDLILSETPNGYLHTVGNLGSKRTSAKRAEAILSSLIEFQKVCLDECILDFLSYCDRLGWTIKFWDVDKFYLEEAITKIEGYLQKQQREIIARQNPTKSEIGLAIERHEYGLAIEQCASGNKSLILDDRGLLIDVEKPVTLLNWQSQFTPFIGRKKELDKLEEWLETESDRSVQIIYGEGGVGKSRLAFHFAEEMLTKGWQAGRDNGDLGGHWYVGQRGILFILDSPEHRIKAVVEFLHAVAQMPELKGKKLRVLLIVRNLHQIERYLGEVDGLIASRMLLKAFEEEDNPWSLFISVWKRLLERGDTTLQTFKQIDAESMRTTFDLWLDRQEAHRKPLVIVAFAIYLFYNEELVGSQSCEFVVADIFRYFSKRESSRLKREVQSFNTSQQLSEPVEYESVVMLVAISAIQGGFDHDNLVEFLKEVAMIDVSFSPPLYKHLSQLSPCIDGGIPCIAPDIFAADFLKYCIDEYAKTDFSLWILLAIGIKCDSISDAAMNDRIDRVTRLQRLISDIRSELGYSWDNQPLKELLSQELGYAEQFSELADFLIIGQEIIELGIASLSCLLSASEQNINQGKKEAIKQADCLKKLGMLISANAAQTQGETVFGHAATAYFSIINDHSYPSHGLNLAFCLYHISEILMYENETFPERNCQRHRAVEDSSQLKDILDETLNCDVIFKIQLAVFFEKSSIGNISAIQAARYSLILFNHFCQLDPIYRSSLNELKIQGMRYEITVNLYKAVLMASFTDVALAKDAYRIFKPSITKTKQSLYQDYINSDGDKLLALGLVKSFTLDLKLARSKFSDPKQILELMFDEFSINKVEFAIDLMRIHIGAFIYVPHVIVDYFTSLKEAIKQLMKADIKYEALLFHTLGVSINFYQRLSWLSSHIIQPVLAVDLIEYCYLVECQRDYLFEARKLLLIIWDDMPNNWNIYVLKLLSALESELERTNSPEEGVVGELRKKLELMNKEGS